MTRYVVYERSTGQIAWRGECSPGDVALQAGGQPELAVLAVTREAAPRSDFVDVAADPPALQGRPVLAGIDKMAIAADDVDTAVLALPVDPCPVTIEAPGKAPETVVVTGGVLHVTSAVPATYRVRVAIWPWQDHEVEIVAT